MLCKTIKKAIKSAILGVVIIIVGLIIVSKWPGKKKKNLLPSETCRSILKAEKAILCEKLPRNCRSHSTVCTTEQCNTALTKIEREMGGCVAQEDK